MDHPPRPGHRALRKGRVSVPGQIYLVSSVTRQREPVFGRFEIACTAAAALSHDCRVGGTIWLAWVLMPDHLHGLIELRDGQRLESVVGRAKAAISRACRRRHGMASLWAPAFHDHALRADEDVAAAARYLIENPVRAGITATAWEYAFWHCAGCDDVDWLTSLP